MTPAESARTFPVTVTVEDGWTRATAAPVHDVCATSGEIPSLAGTLIGALSAHRRLNLTERRAVAHIIGTAVRHAGYYATKSAEPVDFESIALVTCGRTLGVHLQSFAAMSLREKPGRFLCAYRLQVFIGSHGGLTSISATGKRLRGHEALYNFDYYGRGSATRAAQAERAAGKVS